MLLKMFKDVLVAGEQHSVVQAQDDGGVPECSCRRGTIPVTSDGTGVGDVRAEVVVLQGAAGFPQDWHERGEGPV